MWREILQNPGLIDQPLGPQMSRDVSSEKQLCLRQGGSATPLGGGVPGVPGVPQSMSIQPALTAFTSVILFFFSSTILIHYSTLTAFTSVFFIHCRNTTHGIHTLYYIYLCTDTEISFFYFNRLNFCIFFIHYKWKNTLFFPLHKWKAPLRFFLEAPPWSGGLLREGYQAGFIRKCWQKA